MNCPQSTDSRRFPNGNCTALCFELRTRLQTVLWSAELLEMRLGYQAALPNSRVYVQSQVRQIREAVEQTCALLETTAVETQTRTSSDNP
ncbi:MAG: hypothetical protein J7641_00695 [Cyanobacteria bacterium SID2]|nr:hypothetical protein [Cyanobacteria bacterium SID2]MBP0005076.1 hypothetical protein [Cyanobacteria bacterium SBC]